MEKIIGLINAPFTPFYENGEVNYEPIEAYAKLLVKNGLKGVFINGSSGEGYMLTDEERMKLAERWMEVAPAAISSQYFTNSSIRPIFGKGGAIAPIPQAPIF